MSDEDVWNSPQVLNLDGDERPLLFFQQHHQKAVEGWRNWKFSHRKIGEIADEKIWKEIPSDPEEIEG